MTIDAAPGNIAQRVLEKNRFASTPSPARTCGSVRTSMPPMPSTSPYLSVIIPAFNEERTLARHIRSLLPILAEVAEQAWEIIVVDDGSADRTCDIVAAFADQRIAALKLATNSGKGAAIRTGVARSQGQLLLTCDADMATAPQVLKVFVRQLANGCDIVVGNRQDAKSRLIRPQSAIRRFLGRGYAALANLATGLRIQDFSCGFKLYRGRVARQLYALARIDGWATDIEILGLAQRCGYKTCQAPVDWTDGATSSVHIAADMGPVLRDILRIAVRLRRFTPD